MIINNLMQRIDVNLACSRSTKLKHIYACKIYTMIKKFPKSLLLALSFAVCSVSGFAQYKEFKLNAKRDTINIIDKKGLKQGKWVNTQPELRGEPGFVEEGLYKNGEKNGYWRRYTAEGDLLAVENYKLGGKDGLQQYFSFVGELVREENWRGYNPDAPYDTVAVYGAGNNEIIEYKIMKALPYSVKQGAWKYYQSGLIYKTEEYERNNLIQPQAPKDIATKEKPKKVEKTAEMLEWERKNKGKKKVLRDGATGM